MRRPRFSIAWLMALSLLIAVDCMTIRWFVLGAMGEGRMDERLLACVCVLPMANLLALLGMSRLRWLPRPRRPFRAGVEVFGWAAILAVIAFGWLEPMLFMRGFEAMIWTVVPAFRAAFPMQAFRTLPRLIQFVIAILVELGAPLVVTSAPIAGVALIGGWVMSRLRGTRGGSPREDAGPGLAAVAAAG